ncbi:MAG TPA: hypothetical protein VKT75_05775 [Acidobacteriaceae bacterium]|nr:hypothetical protein [Acidobacteriaceae bacterium]
MEEIESAVMRITSLGAAADKQLAAASVLQPGGARNRSMTFPIGTNVFDLVTGQNGVVIDGKRESITIPTA